MARRPKIIHNTLSEARGERRLLAVWQQMKRQSLDSLVSVRRGEQLSVHKVVCVTFEWTPRAKPLLAATFEAHFHIIVTGVKCQDRRERQRSKSKNRPRNLNLCAPIPNLTRMCGGSKSNVASI